MTRDAFHASRFGEFIAIRLSSSMFHVADKREGTPMLPSTL